MQIYRIRVWRKWKVLETVDYLNEEEARKAKAYVMQHIPVDAKVHVQLLKTRLKTRDSFSPADFDFLLEQLKRG
jgi:hypothetical protein